MKDKFNLYQTILLTLMMVGGLGGMAIFMVVVVKELPSIYAYWSLAIGMSICVISVIISQILIHRQYSL